MRLKRWIWEILQDGRDHWFDEHNDIDHQECPYIRYSKGMFLPDGEIDIALDDGSSYYMKSKCYVRKYHIEKEPIVTLPKELFEI